MPPLSPGLWLYLGLTAFADGWVRRKLARRAEAGHEDPARIGERFGRASRPRPEGRLVWMHGASVGEVLALVELIRRLREERPDLAVLVTSGTVTSARIAAERLPEGVIHQFAPVDTRAAVRRFLDHWRPDLALWAESELWPRLVLSTARRGVPMLLVNARMSARSFRRWRRAPLAARALLGRFARVLTQDEANAARFARLGVPPARLEVTGSLKAGASPPPCDEGERARMRAAIGARPVWLAASTHEGEEEIVIEAHRRARRGAQGLLLILCPRHPERGDAVAALVEAAGLRLRRRSAGELPDDATEVYLADTLGEMGLWYRLTPVAFVGGSLVPVGGHNPYEPAALGAAILHGPHVDNFARIYAELDAAGGAREVRDAAGLVEALRALRAPAEAAAMAAAAWDVASRGAEVTERALALVLAALEGRELPRPAVPPRVGLSAAEEPAGAGRAAP